MDAVIRAQTVAAARSGNANTLFDLGRHFFRTAGYQEVLVIHIAEDADPAAVPGLDFSCVEL
jgi:hypothetical protein